MMEGLFGDNEVVHNFWYAVGADVCSCSELSTRPVSVTKLLAAVHLKLPLSYVSASAAIFNNSFLATIKTRPRTRALLSYIMQFYTSMSEPDSILLKFPRNHS